MYTHTHTHLRIEFIRVNSAAGTRRVARERERALQAETATGARVFVPPPVIMKKLRLSRPLYVRVHTYTGAGVQVECANARERGGTCVQPRS